MIPRTLALILIATAAPASGQTAVQQPTFGVTSAATTVSVPDRGSAFVGGVGRAASARTFGPAGRGPLATGASASGISAGVTVHDFAAMDAAVLAAARGAAPPPSFAKSRYDDATSHAMARRLDAGRMAGSDRSAAGRKVSEPDVAELLARRDAAERRGEPGVAAIYARLAAKRGAAGTEPAGIAASAE